MRTEYKYGDRSPEQRQRYKDAWLCDNKNCDKVYHYAPYCVNTWDLKLKSFVWRIIGRTLTKVGL